ncbi:MAG: AAA family ATPase [Rhodospirillales bacterium]|nr:AAA family ATPase [Rhodospirillales bacterium]
MNSAANGSMAMTGFPTRAPIELEDRPRQQQWLIDGLWGRQAVGIVGGEPKCGKSFLALDLAVAVAAGVPCLRRFAADQPGPVLLFAAEDAGHIVRARLQGIASAAGARFDALDIAVIDVPALRLDHRADRQRLVQTVERVRPRLVVLDPLVRLHGVDENTVAEVAPILGFLRDVQRRFETAVLLVHHARKSGATRPGQALRGSSELHAWGDSNLYLRRRDRQILMTVEHRAAPGLNDIEIELADDGNGPALRLRQVETGDAAPRPDNPERRILQALADAEAPLSQRQIRERAATRHKTVGAVLNKLVREGRIRHDAEGRYSLVTGESENAAPDDDANGSRHPDAARFPPPGSAHP